MQIGWPPRARRWLGWILLSILLALTATTTYSVVRFLLTEPGRSDVFFDHGVFLDKLARYRETGQLYDTDPDDLRAGTPVFKYPPPCAALILLIDPKPQANLGADERAAHARPFVLLGLAGLLASLAIVLAVFRPPLIRALVLVVILFNWQALWETLIGPQYELLILLLLTLSWLGIRSGRAWLAGVPVAISGALKAYPWALGAHFLVRRQGRAILWLCAGTVVAMAAAAFALGWGLTVEYMTRVLPYLGDTSALGENYSLLGGLKRLTFALFGDPATAPASATGLAALLVRPGPSGAPWLAWALALPIAIGFVLGSTRAVRAAGALPAPTRESLAFGLSLSLGLILLPSSWANYQALLALPVMLAICLAPPAREDRWTWGLLIAAGVLASVSPDSVVRRPQVTFMRNLLQPIHGASLMRGFNTWLRTDAGELAVTLARTLVPVLVWLAHVRLLRRPRGQG